MTPIYPVVLLTAVTVLALALDATVIVQKLNGNLDADEGGTATATRSETALSAHRTIRVPRSRNSGSTP